MTLVLRHPNTGIIKRVKVGFSWTYFFFSIFVPLFRGDLKWFILGAIICICTLGVGDIVLCFIYNRIYTVGLIEKGFRISEVEGGSLTDASARLGIRLQTA